MNNQDQIEEPVYTSISVRNKMREVTRHSRYIDPSLLPNYIQFHKLSANVMMVVQTKKVFFCPGISRTHSVEGYSSIWKTQDINNDVVLIYDTSYDGDYWKALRDIFQHRIAYYELMKKDLLENGYDSKHCLTCCFDRIKNRYSSAIRMVNSNGTLELTKFCKYGPSARSKVESLLVDACIARCVTYIDMMERTLELLKKPKENLISYDDWLAGKPII